MVPTVENLAWYRCFTMATERASVSKKDTVEILLDKVANMREEMLTIERALERIQREALELAQSRNGPAKKTAKKR